MWHRYRKWKSVVVFPLALAALLLMRGEPKETISWNVGIGIAVVLGLIYLIEEIVWIARNQGRPCSGCGEKLRLKPFRVWARCPHCGVRQ